MSLIAARAFSDSRNLPDLLLYPDLLPRRFSLTTMDTVPIPFGALSHFKSRL